MHILKTAFITTILAATTACGPSATAPPPQPDTPIKTPTPPEPTARPEPVAPPPTGTLDDPIPVPQTPFSDTNTTAKAENAFDSHPCGNGVDYRGAEIVYSLNVPAPSLLRASVNRMYGEDVDVDIFALVGEDRRCLDGHDLSLLRMVPEGPLLIVVDTRFDGERALAGDFEVSIDLEPPPGPCAMESHDMLALWHRCSHTLDCYEEPPLEFPVLRMPAKGPVVMEAHLVTEEEADLFKGGWPKSSRDGLKRHYDLTEKASGYSMKRRNVWAPAGEGLNVSRFGEGSSEGYVPAAHEVWAINMFWAFPPPRGARMIVINPENGKAVVASAGYEKGPGSNTAIGGAVEEVHHHLGSRHRKPLIMGFALDQTLPFGPIEGGCPQSNPTP